MQHQNSDGTIPDTSRRGFIMNGLTFAAGGLALPALTVLSGPAEAKPLALPGGGTYEIAFHNQHTGENFRGAYRVGNKYLPDAFDEINHVLRDFRTGEEFPIDPRVVDIIYMVRRKTGTQKPLEILSGYRSPKTNAMLRRASGGVARNSLHLTGQAIDFRLPGYRTRGLRDIAASLRTGGVGFYPNSDFVHVDTGKFRTW